MSLNTSDNFWAFYKRGKNSWDNTLTINYGFTSTSDLGLQKSSDMFDLLSRYGHQIDSSKWYLSAMFDFRSQFTNGYNYYRNIQGKDSNQLISQFMAPAYILLSPGVEYKPKDWFSLFLSPVSGALDRVHAIRCWRRILGSTTGKVRPVPVWRLCQRHV